MIKNNKGITIVEIIISVTLISIVMILLFTVLITVRDEDERGKVVSNLLINQALIVKEIENDFIELGLIGIASCNDGEFYLDKKDTVLNIIPSSSSLRTSAKGNCLKLIYNSAKTEDNIGYLLYYSYGFSATEQTTIVGYRRGDVRVLRETPILHDTFGTYLNNCASTHCSLKIDLPILNEYGEDFGINLSYIYKNDASFSITGLTNDTKYRFKIED